MDLRFCYNASEDTFPLPLHIKELYGPFGFPKRRDTQRPYISSNLVMGLDGKASFRELKGRAGGREVSRSREDRWLMDFLRAHHDGQLIGANTLREEPGTDARGADYAIDDEQLRVYREETLGLDKQKVIILTGSGNIGATVRVFDSPRVEPWIVTSAEGENNLRSHLKVSGRKENIKIVSVGAGKAGSILRLQRKFCGKSMASGRCFVRAARRCMANSSRNTSLMRTFGRFRSGVGQSTKPGIDRPTTYGDVSYTPESAPWFRLISLHYAVPHHAFFRFRYEGPRKFRNYLAT